MSAIPDSWDDDWSSAAATTSEAAPTEQKKLTTKQTKAQKRAAQAEFNRQLWAEAEGPRETNYFLESRNVVPFKQEFRAPTVLLSRKGPIVERKQERPGVHHALEKLDIRDVKQEESSEDEDEKAAKQKALEDQQLQAQKNREEKRRLYEQRRLELMGPTTSSGTSTGRPSSRSGNSSPGSLTPPGSRSSTPSRGGRKPGKGRGNNAQNQYALGRPHQLNPQSQIFDPQVGIRPDILRRMQGGGNASPATQPIREPRRPDGTAGFAVKNTSVIDE